MLNSGTMLRGKLLRRSQKERTRTMEKKVVNYLLETYATDDAIRGSNA